MEAEHLIIPANKILTVSRDSAEMNCRVFQKITFEPDEQ